MGVSDGVSVIVSVGVSVGLGVSVWTPVAVGIGVLGGPGKVTEGVNVG